MPIETIEGEKVYLYNPYDVVNWNDEMIEKQIRHLLPMYRGDADDMTGISKNIFILANITYLFGEMIARLTREYTLDKVKVESKENKQITIERNSWIKENAGEKAPAMKYFEAKASEFVYNDYEALTKKLEQLTRFKNAYDSYEQIMNALKKRLDSIRYEEFNK